MDQRYRLQLEELRIKLPIDQHNLDEECRNQAVLYDGVGDLAMNVRTEARQAKEHLEFTKADLSTKIRKDPSKYGIDKVTEASIDAVIRLQKEFEDANKEAIEAAGISDAFGVLLSAVEQRKSMLKDLVSLYIYQYFNTKQDLDLQRTTQRIDAVTEDEITEFRNRKAQKS